MKNENASDRSRNWATVVYPDSALDNWIDLLRDLCISCFVSPLHDKDKDGEVDKKAHYHVLCKFNSMKSRSQVLEIFEKFSGVGAEKINDFRSYSRYLCHLDQPQKAQYNISDVVSIGDLDYLSIIGSAADKYIVISDILKYIDTHQDTIKYSFSKLLRYCRDNEETWFRALCDNCSYVIKEYLTSCEWEMKKENDEAKLRDYEESMKKYSDFVN